MENDYLKKYQTGGAPVFEFAPVANPYVDMHQAEISKTLADRWTQNRDKYDTMSQAIGSMQVLPEEEWKKTRALKRAEDTLGSVVEVGNWDDATMGVRNAINEFAADTDLIQAAESMALRKEELATQTELGEGNYIDFGTTPVIDPNTGLVQYDQEGNVIEQHKTTGYDTAKQGLYQSGTVKRLDHIKRARTLMSSIHMDPIGLQNLRAITGVESLTPQDALSYLMSGDELGGDKVISVAEAVLPGYAASSEGQQRMRELTEKLINPDTEQLYTEVEAGKILLQDLISTAAPQIGKTQKYTRSAESLGGPTDVDGPVNPMYETSTTAVVHKNKLLTFDRSDYSEEGKYKTKVATNRNPFALDPDATLLLTDEDRERVASGVIQDKEVDLKRIEKALENKGTMDVRDLEISDKEKLLYLTEKHSDLRLETTWPNGEPESDADFAERLASLYQGPEATLQTVYVYPGEMKASYAKDKLDSISSLDIVGLTQDGEYIGDTDKPLNFDQIAAKATGIILPFGIGDTKEGWKEGFIGGMEVAANRKVTVAKPGRVEVRGLKIDGPMAGATEVIYTSPEKHQFTLFIGGGDQTKRNFTELNEVVELRNSLDDNTILEYFSPDKDPISSEDKTSKFVPETQQIKLFLENSEDETAIVPVLKERYLSSDGNISSAWEALDAGYISRKTQTALDVWSASGNDESKYLNPVSDTRSTITKPRN